MPAQFTTPLVVTIPGQIIASSLWNGEFTNLFNNLTPAGIDTWSNTDVQMQTATDPFPGGVTSRPTSIAGEIERLRFEVNAITGNTYWYQRPPNNLTTLIPAGTVMVFYQAAAPTGWTQVTTHNDQALRVVSGTGGSSGGINVFSGGLNHTHTMGNHVHASAAHTHTMGNHTHSTPSHTHILNYDTSTIFATSASANTLAHSLDADGDAGHFGFTGSGPNQLVRNYNYPATKSGGSGTSGGPSTNTTDSTTPGTTSGPNTNTTDAISPTFQYIDVIIASKN